MGPPIAGLAVDVGNSRIKLGRVDEAGRLDAALAVDPDDELAWTEALATLDPGWRSARVAVASVHPDRASRFMEWFIRLNWPRVPEVVWFRSAAAVPVVHRLAQPERAGADRALAVLAAGALLEPGRPGLLVCCGTAITVERIEADGQWPGGAIAAGLPLLARALNQGTAQLPMVGTRGEFARGVPRPWGDDTETAMGAGVFWGAVGSVRELIWRIGRDLHPEPRILWTGGDAARLAPWVSGSEARVQPDLVLQGLALAAFRPWEPAA